VQGHKAKANLADAFTKDATKKTRQSERSVQRDATRAKKVAVLPDIVGTSLDKGAEMDALAKLPESEQRSLAEAAKRGEKVSAISARSACDHEPEDPKMSDRTEEIELGKAIARVRRAQPRNADTMPICNALERRLKTARAPGTSGPRKPARVRGSGRARHQDASAS
jgi:hypothetical protein